MHSQHETKILSKMNIWNSGSLNSEKFHYFSFKFETEWNERTNYFCKFLAIYSANISMERMNDLCKL